jgi:hypothetical protein
MPGSSCRRTCRIICNKYESGHRELRKVAPFDEAEVIARIKLGERGEDSAVIGRLLWEAPWLQRIWAAFEAKPVLAGAFGLAMCAFLITGVIYSEKGDVQPVALIPVTEAVPSSPDVANAIADNHPLLARPAALYASSTNPITALQIDGPLLGGLRLHAEPASLPFSGRN